ncbi:hypothetical protein V8F20_008934 [Naviculisporaceae sp. PSN 640]
MVPGGPFYSGEAFPDFSTSTFPSSVPIPVTAADDAFENALRQHHDDQLAVLGAAAPPNLYTPAGGQINDFNNSLSSYPILQSDPSKDDVIMISRQSWQHALSETNQAKKERDELRLQLATVRNELYTAKRVQKQLRMELDEVKVAAKTLRRQSTTLAETQKRLRKERNEARIKVAILSKGYPRDHAAAMLKAVSAGNVGSNKSRDPLALLLGQAPAATPLAESNAGRGGDLKMSDTGDNTAQGATESSTETQNQMEGAALSTQQTQQTQGGSNNNQWHFIGSGGDATLEAIVAMDESPENQIVLDPDDDDDQRLIDAFLAETSANSGGELSPTQTGFSPTTMAELFGGGGVDIT